MYGILKKIFDFSGQRKGLLKKSLILSFVNGLVASLQFLALFFVVDALSTGNKDTRIIWVAFGIMLASVLGRIIASYFSMNEQTVVGYGMVADKRIYIGDRLRYIPMGYFNKNTIGTITATVTTTLGDVENSAARVLVAMLGGLFGSVSLIIFIFIFDWRIGILAFVGVFCYLVVTEIASKKSSACAEKRQVAQSKLVEAVLEYLQGMGVVKAFGLENNSRQSIGAAIQTSSKENLKLVHSLLPYCVLQQLTVRIFGVLLLALTLYLYLAGAFSLAYAVVLVIASFAIFGSLENAGNMISLLQLLASSMDTANSIDNTPVMDEKGADIVPKSHDITFDDVSFSYSDRTILEHINLSIPAKTMTAIVGPSGGGKTTACRLIARFWDVDTGKVTLGGTDVRDFKLDSLMKNISMVFQNVYLFADTIENNIKFGCPDATHEQVVAAAMRACCHNFISALPDGYKTVVGESGSTLSGGEKQRISIARALLKDAPIIILDEATSSVDPENEDELQRAIEALTCDKTVITIAHRLKTVKNADQILVLDEAHIVQRGTHSQLIQEKGLYADFIHARQEATGWKLACGTVAPSPCPPAPPL
jgi:ATP-binding cassette subfamily B protein